MTLGRVLSISAALLFPFLLQAEADGPDYWEIQSNTAVGLMHDRGSPEPILMLPTGTDGLANKGCSGLPSYNEWLTMTDKERNEAEHNAWCRVVYGNVEGWVSKIYLVEGHPPSPSFDCSKASGQVENLICKETTLMLLDRNMDQTYQQAVTRIKSLDVGSEPELKTLKAYQRGWIKGRNDCWKARDIARCVKANYQNRISKLQAKWMLLPSENAVNFFCTDNSDVFITFYASLLPSASVERGDQRQIYVSDGDNENYYSGDFGRYFEIDENNLQIRFNPSSVLTCKLN